MEETQNTSTTEDDGQAPEVRIPENSFLVIDGRKTIPLDKAIVTVGRSHDNTLVIDDPRVSRHHAEIRVIRDNFVLFDLNSSGGTYVNGQRTGQGMLYPGDMISFAGVNIVFMRGTHLPGRSAEGSNTLVGPGQRPTAVFNTSLFKKKK